MNEAQVIPEDLIPIAPKKRFYGPKMRPAPKAPVFVKKDIPLSDWEIKMGLK